MTDCSKTPPEAATGAGPQATVDEGAARRIAFTVAATFFMETLDSTIVVTALPAMAAEFGVTPLQASMTATAYLVAMAAGVPASGWLAQRFGARRVFALAVAGFTLASLLCGLAPTLPALLAARALQGLSATCMSPVGRLVVLRETPRRRLIEAIGTITWPGLIAPVLGPPLGGLLALHASWRWIFWLNVPLGVLGCWLVLRIVPHRPPQAPGRFDGRGFALTALALAASIEGLTRLGERQGNPLAAAALLALGLAIAVLAVRHLGRVPEPLLDLRVLRVATYRFSAAGGGFLARVAIHASPFLLPLMFQIAFGLDAFQAGTMVLVYMAGNLAMKIVTTPLLRRFGFRPVLLVNGALCTVSLAGCGMLSPGDPSWLVLSTLFLAGTVRSMQFTASSTLAFADVADEQRAPATALSSLLQQLSMALALALAALLLGTSQWLRGAATLELADFRHAWLAMAAVMAVATACAVRLERHAGAAVSRPA